MTDRGGGDGSVLRLDQPCRSERNILPIAAYSHSIHVLERLLERVILLLEVPDTSVCCSELLCGISLRDSGSFARGGKNEEGMTFARCRTLCTVMRGQNEGKVLEGAMKWNVYAVDEEDDEKDPT